MTRLSRKLQKQTGSESQAGYVKWFNPRAGYGFIASNGSEYFIHYKNIDMSGYKKLEPGQSVEFVTQNYEGHIQATNVRIKNAKQFGTDQPNASGRSNDPDGV